MRLPTVLHEPDMPIAELSSLCLDGILFPVGDGFVVVDSPEDPGARAASLRALGDERIAARSTAAWIWGALPRLTRPLQVSVHVRRSQAVEPLRGVTLRESTLAADEVVEVSGLLVTSRSRTALDLARERDFGELEARAITELLEGRVPLVEKLIASLSQSRFQRERIRARHRLSALLAA